MGEVQFEDSLVAFAVEPRTMFAICAKRPRVVVSHDDSVIIDNGYIWTSAILGWATIEHPRADGEPYNYVAPVTFADFAEYGIAAPHTMEDEDTRVVLAGAIPPLSEELTKLSRFCYHCTPIIKPDTDPPGPLGAWWSWANHQPDCQGLADDIAIAHRTVERSRAKMAEMTARYAPHMAGEDF